MLKLLRWLLTILLVLVVGGIIAAQFITFNQFKDLAAQKVKEATGRTLEIAGDIKLSFYPVLGAKVARVSLSNMIGAEQPSMLSVEEAVIGVKLLPLLHQRIEFDKIILNKPVVNLEKNAAGQGNWEFPNANRETGENGTTENNGRSLPPVQLSGIEINDGILSYYDAKSGNAVELAKVNANISMVNLESYARINASAEYQGKPIKLMLETDSPSALLSETGSGTSMEASVQGISGRLQGKVSVVPERIRITNLEAAMQKIVAKGVVDVALGGEVPVVNATLDFGTVNLEPLLGLASAATLAAQPAAAENRAAASAKTSYLDTAIFKSIEGSMALSADRIETNNWKISQPKIRANMANGMVAMAAAGQFSSDAQPPMNITFTTADLGALLHPDGGPFALKAKSQDKDVNVQGNLAAVPQRITLSDANIRFNGETITGHAVLAEKSGEQALDANIEWMKNGRSWKIAAATPAVLKLREPEGADLALTLQSSGQKAQVQTHFSNDDQVMKLNPLTLVLNGGTGKGYVTYDQKNAKPELDVNMNFASLDVNPLLAFAEDSGDAASGGGGAAAAGKNKATPLKQLNAKINLEAKELKVKNIRLTNVDLDADLKDGVLSFNLPDVGLYQGKASAQGRVDGNAATPHYSVSTKGSGVNIGTLLAEAMQDNTFAGIGQWSAEVSGSGFETPALYSTLNGKGEFEVQQGVIRGMDLLQLMSAARSQMVESLVQTTDETNQLHAKGSFSITKGVIENDDLVLQSPNLEASGKGRVSLPQWRIDYRFEPKVGERRKAGEGEKFVGQSIPVLVQGSLDKPRIFPDPKALINTGIDALKSVKELGIGDKVKEVEKYLAPLGLGSGANTNPPAEQAPATTPEGQAPAAQPTAPARQQKVDPLDALRGIFGQ